MTLECDVCKAERLERHRVVGASDDPRFKQSTRTHTFFCLSQCLSFCLCAMLVVDICYRRPSTISPNITLRYAGHPSCRRRTCIRGTTTKRLPSCAPSNARARLLSSTPSYPRWRQCIKCTQGRICSLLLLKLELDKVRVIVARYSQTKVKVT